MGRDHVGHQFCLGDVMNCYCCFCALTLEQAGRLDSRLNDGKVDPERATAATPRKYTPRATSVILNAPKNENSAAVALLQPVIINVMYFPLAMLKRDTESTRLIWRFTHTNFISILSIKHSTQRTN